MAKESQLKMIKMKGYKGYVWEGFKAIAKMYDTIKWGNGKKPKEVVKTPFKTTYKF